MKTKITLTFIVLLSLIFLNQVGAVEIGNQTIFYSSESNSTIRVEQDTVADTFEVTSEYLEIWNLTTEALFTNVNASFNGELHLRGLTNALIYNSNGTVYGSTVISDNDGNVNVTLPAGNDTYVLDEFNLSEGTTRTNNPITLTTSSDDTSKTFTSTLQDTINQTRIEVDVASCNRLGSVTYTSTTGSHTDSWNGGDATCSSRRLVLTIDGIENGANTLSISYNSASMDICEGFGDAGNTFVTFFVIIIIVAVAGGIMLLLFTDTGGEMDLLGIAFAIVVGGAVLSIGASIIFRIGGC